MRGVDRGQVSLDCNDPEGAVFTCVATNKSPQQQQAPPQQAAPQLPFPWEQMVDQNACWCKVAPHLEGDSARRPHLPGIHPQGFFEGSGRASTPESAAETARQSQKAPQKCSPAQSGFEMRTRHFALQQEWSGLLL